MNPCPHCNRPIPESVFHSWLYRNREAVLRQLRVVKGGSVLGEVREGKDGVYEFNPAPIAERKED